MAGIYRVYQAASSILASVGFPLFRVYSRITGRHRDGLGERMGRYSPVAGNPPGSKTPRIWIHAASMGEVTAADALMPSLFRLFPDAAVIVSTVTEHGHGLAARLFADKRVRVVYAPIDFMVSVRRSLRMFSPDLLVFMETELWPNWIVTASRMGVPTVLVNGRISDRTIDRYLKIRSLTRELLGCMRGFSMIHAQDADRIQRMGAPKERVEINGNIKYDRLLNLTGEPLRQRMHQTLLGGRDRQVLLAGSIRQQEYRLVLDAYERVSRMFPDLLLILAPRHLGRVKEIEQELSRRSLRFQRRTDMNIADSDFSFPVLILNSMGELQAAYSVADVVFCGGSLVPKGGQNIMEPAAWGKPVLYGPYMDDFRDAKEMLEGSGGQTVADAGQLYQWVKFLLENPGEGILMGKRARNTVELNRGAAERHVRFLQKLVNRPPAIPHFGETHRGGFFRQ